MFKRIFLIVFVVGNFAAAQNLPDAPSSKLETKIIRFVDIGAVVWDAGLSIHAQSQGWVEMNPLFGKHPSPQRFILQMGIASAGVQFIAHKLAQHHHEKWGDVLMAGDASAHLWGIASTMTADDNKKKIKPISPCDNPLHDCEQPFPLQK